MAHKQWRGDAAAVKQVNNVTPASVTIGNIFTLTMNGKTVTFTATAATVANVTAGLAAAVLASTIPEFRTLTASDQTTYLRLTANTAGVPFTQTSSSADGAGSAGHSLTTTTPTASSGPNHYGVAANWSPSGVPVDADDIDLSGSSVSILYDLDQSSVDPATLEIPASFTGKIGLPPYNPLGYYEYLPTTLIYRSTAVVDIGEGQGNGSSRLRLDVGDQAACVATIHSTGTPESSTLPALILSGGTGASQLNVLKGSVGLAIEPESVADFATIRVGSAGSQASDVTLTCGPGAVLDEINQCGGNVTVESDVTTWWKGPGSTSTAQGTAAVDSLVQDGPGVHYWLSNGTLAEAVMRGPGAVLDASRDLRARTLTDGDFYFGAAILDPLQTIAMTNGILTDNASLKASNLGNAPFTLVRS